MTPDFFNLSYLRIGSEVQQKGINAIEDLQVMQILRAHDPVLAGTLPLDLFTRDSDLDILCFSPDLSEIKTTWRSHYKTCEDFSLYLKRVNTIDSIIAKFKSGGFRFELFAQAIPTKQQSAYIHMVNEYKLLAQHGQSLRDKILALKQAGIKTEPAFAQALNLPGNPYQTLLTWPS
ncbi:MAG TPA: DUF4269 domain-containing protein [Cyclobacteriaceae bacterium]|nr:DUF4269 domain-containing protein [Cyclobacteriaceae bacterium]